MALDWKQLGTEIAKLGLPLLGAALPVPGGAAIGAALASHIGAPSSDPTDILNVLAASTEAVQKAKEFELTHQETMLRITLEHEATMRQADTADLTVVNNTIQEELKHSAEEAWYQKAWRPFNGFVVGAGSLIGVIAVAILFFNALKLPAEAIGLACSQVPLLAGAIAAILAVPGAAVGITSWHKGQLQREQVKNNL